MLMRVFLGWLRGQLVRLPSRASHYTRQLRFIRSSEHLGQEYLFVRAW
jgi:hypothetical protein